MSEGQTMCQQKLLHKRRRIDKNFCKNMIIQASTPSTMHEKSFTLCRRSSSFHSGFGCAVLKFSVVKGEFWARSRPICAPVSSVS